MSLHGGNPWAAYQGFTNDRSVKKKQLSSGTLKRVMTYATEFRAYIFAYLSLIVFDSLLVVAAPLLFKQIVDTAIPNKDSGMVIYMSLLIAGTSILGAALGLISRRMSSTIGEGLIFNMRTQVFDHVQQQSIAFFTRAQTGALISRLNSDVMGAQRAFTSTLGGVVGNLISLVVVAATMVFLSWQITVASLLMLPLFMIPARWMGSRLQLGNEYPDGRALQCIGRTSYEDFWHTSARIANVFRESRCGSNYGYSDLNGKYGFLHGHCFSGFISDSFGLWHGWSFRN